MSKSIKLVDFNKGELQAYSDIIFSAKSVAATAVSSAFYLGDVQSNLEIVVEVNTALDVGTSVAVGIVKAATAEAITTSSVPVITYTATADVAAGTELIRYVIPKDYGPYFGVLITSTGTNTGAIDAYVHQIAQ